MIEARAVNHIGIAVRSIDNQRDFYERVLGARLESIETVADQHVRVAIYQLGADENGVRIEVFEPTSANSSVAQFIEKRGEGLHHVAYTVDNIADRLRELMAAGMRLIDEKPRRGAHGAQIAFLHPKAAGGVLTELCQPPAAQHGGCVPVIAAKTKA